MSGNGSSLSISYFMVGLDAPQNTSPLISHFCIPDIVGKQLDHRIDYPQPKKLLLNRSITGALASGPDLSEHTLSLHLKIATNWNTEPDHSHQKRWHILPKLV
ncbi:hypothetical protein PGTUg99_025779 [Puccinia graminis f. sp. tritici]|uniref:Uncharacterized protein n=1 Tax=Puccinia graminis f. sp. tritici TaxID=56615 RepID=A0A5B0MIK2_PUCGR|nr:hypothetical protein PGTUg99_025779 [Puccinia graminis f. sp. tritici]